MKLRTFFSSIFLASTVYISFCTNIVFAKNECSLEIRPNENEIAFAATGSKLLAAENICTGEYLEIPYDQKIGGVALLKGQYQRIDTNKKDITFKAVNNAGDRVQSCLWCDRIDRLMVNDTNALCSISFLNIRSCAKIGEAVFSIQRKKVNLGEVCVPSLAYFGRIGSELRFALQDCKNMSVPALTYDLSYGNIIRFLDERIEVIKADNSGIHYRRFHIREPQLGIEH